MNTIKTRKEAAQGDCWDLSSLFPTEQSWEERFQILKPQVEKIVLFKSTLGGGAQNVLEALKFFLDLEQTMEKLGTYAHLRTTEDVADSGAQERLGRFMSLATQVEAMGSWFNPELQSLDPQYLQSLLENPILMDYWIYLGKILRYKPHVLSEEGEKIMALGQESQGAIRQTFSSLTNGDLEFGTLETPEGQKPLTQSTFALFLQHKNRDVRRRAFDQFYQQFAAHKNTLAQLFSGNVQQDLFRSRVRNFPSCRSAALFPDKVPEEVYDNLVQTIRENLPLLHRYYKLRQQTLGVEKLHHCDVYAPMVPQAEMIHTYDQAVDKIVKSLEPLGSEYTETLQKGLLGGWVDRFENKGKRSGAFSSGAYGSSPVILMNFKEESLRDVFTLTHEGGHSMHSWYSQNNNPYQHYSYTIFEAEVASTFNEQLLAKYLLKSTEDKNLKAYLISKGLEDMVATIFRQTMFAEYEQRIHKLAEDGEALTLDCLRTQYRELLVAYFGPDVELSEYSDLEGLRIPHFYGAFYVYKYATGLSAAIALSTNVLEKGEPARRDYLKFLKSGGSHYPLESLKLAGVDMSTPAPVKAAMKVFEKNLLELENLLLS